MILLMSVSSAPARIQLGEHLLGRVGPEAVGVRVVALPGDDVDPDVVAQLQRRRVGDVAGERVLAEHVARQLVAEVAAQPPLVGVVPVAAVEVEGDPADAALGPRDLEVGVVAQRRTPQQVLRGRSPRSGVARMMRLSIGASGRQLDGAEAGADVQAHHHVLLGQRLEDRVPVLDVVVARQPFEVRQLRAW